MAAELKKGTQRHSDFLQNIVRAHWPAHITVPECFQVKNKAVVRIPTQATLQPVCGHFHCTVKDRALEM